MHPKLSASVVCAGLLVLPNLLLAAQNPTLGDFIKGSSLPPHMKASDLTPEWKAVKLKLAGDSGGGLFGGSFMSILMMSGAMSQGRSSPNGADKAMGLLKFTDSYWSKGEMTHVGTQDFLIAYKFELGLSLTTLSHATAGPNLSATLDLTLVRADLVTSISPQPDLTGPRLATALAEAGVASDVPGLSLGDTNQNGATEAAVLAPVYAQARLAAQKAGGTSNAKQIALGLVMYCGDYDDMMPYAQSTKAVAYVIQPYLRNNDLWKTNNPRGTEFRFNMNVAGVLATSIKDPANTPMIFESGPWPDGTRIVAFVDGHAKSLRLNEWNNIQPLLNRKFPKSSKPLPLNYGLK